MAAAVVVLCMVTAGWLLPPTASAATGDILRTFTPAPSGNGRAVAFDGGTTLYYTFVGDQNIYRVTTSGVSLGAIPNPGPRGFTCGALAFDGTDLWCGTYEGTGNVWTVDPISGNATFRFSFVFAADNCFGQAPGSIDGLALDGDGTLWLSDDGGRTIYHATAGGGVIASFPTPGGACNSGIEAVGSNLSLVLFDASTGANLRVVQVAKSSPSGPLVLSFPAQDLEDLAFDEVTFAPSCVLWGNSAGTDIVNAYEIPCPTPVAVCKDVTVPTDPGVCTASNVSVDNGSFDPDGDPVTVTQSPAGPYSLGDTGVTLTATDPGGLSDSCTATVTVVDQEAPVISCPAAQTIECTSPDGAHATVKATATDNCSVGQVGCSPGSETFPIGTTPVSCTATDGSGNTSSCTTSVTVVDTTPPTVTCVQSVNPSGKNVPAAGDNPKSGQNPDGFYQVGATDVCTLASAVTITLGSVTLGQGETIKITQSPGQSGVTLVNEMGQLAIKHFRVGPGDAVITATDAAGNVATVSCLVPPPPK
jgi:hypothetical protein